MCLSFFLIVGFKLFKNADYEIPKSEQAVNTVLGQTKAILKKRYKIDPVATNVAMPGGIIKLLGLDFQIVGPLNKERIREILIDCTQELLNKVNTNPQIKPYLEQYPFTIKNIEINLFIVDSTRREINHPEIGIARISEGQLNYLTLMYTGIPQKINDSSESYEEAITKIEEQN